MTRGLIKGEDDKTRCWWPGNDPLYRDYHDYEWGRPCNDDIKLYEKICLEGFQAGLSWLTILRKRENFRKAFSGFDFEKVARFTEKDIERLVLDAGIIRHRGKIEAAINNAKKTCEIIDELGSLSVYFWGFPQRHCEEWNDEAIQEDGPNSGLPRRLTPPRNDGDIPSQTIVSKSLSKDLKKRGFKFVGPTTMYAHMQAMGMVNDHLEGCCVRETIEKERQKFKRP